MHRPRLAAAALAALLAFVAAPAVAQDTGALLSFSVTGNVREGDQSRLQEAVERGLSTGPTPRLLGYNQTRDKLGGVAPEVLGCFTQGCLVRAGQALDVRAAYRVIIKEEFEIYAVSVTAYSLVDGSKLAEVEGACEICTLDEALDTAVQASEATASGWSYPALTVAADPFGDRAGDKDVEPPTVVEPPKTVVIVPVAPTGPTVRVALYADPPDATIRVDGKPVGTGRFVGTLAVGTHTVEMERSGHSKATEKLELREEDGPTYLAVHLRPLVAPVSGGGRRGGAIDEVDREPLAWGLAGGGAVFVVGGAVLLGVDGESACKGSVVLSECKDVFSTGTGGGLLLAAGAAAITASVTLFLWDELAGRPSEPAPVSVGLGLTPDEGGVQGSVVLLGRF